MREGRCRGGILRIAGAEDTQLARAGQRVVDRAGNRVQDFILAVGDRTTVRDIDIELAATRVVDDTDDQIEIPSDVSRYLIVATNQYLDGSLREI